jgi:hypothetical protein
LEEGVGEYKLEEFEDVEEADYGDGESDQEPFDEFDDSQDEDEEEGHSESYGDDEYDEFLYDYSESEDQRIYDLLEEMMGNHDEYYEPPSRSSRRAARPAILPASHFKCSICGTQAVRRVAGPNAMPHNQGRAFTSVRRLLMEVISNGKMGRCRFQGSHKRGSTILWTQVLGIIDVSTLKFFVYYYFKYSP